MTLNGRTTTIPRRLDEDDLPALADALGVPDNGTATLRAPCVHPDHAGDGDANMRVYLHDDGTLGAVCGSHGCAPTVLLAQLAKLIEGEPRGSGGDRKRREPRPLPTDDELADWTTDLRTLAEEIYGTRGRDMLRAAGWEGHHERLAELGIGFSGSSITIPVYGADGDLQNVVGYRPAAPRDKKNHGQPGRSKGLVPAPESTEDNRIVYVFEGEPDGIAATLAGLPATSFPGADGWRPEYVERFKRFRRVIIVPDCDEPGRKAAERIRTALTEHGVNVSVIELDASQTRGHDFRDLAKEIGMHAAAERVRGLADDAIPDTTDLLSEIVDFLRAYIIFGDEWQAQALALWVLHTYAIEAAEVSPYIVVTAPLKRCGKTQLRDALAMIVARAWQIDAAPTEAVLFRKISATAPTILLDEADALFNGSRERTEPLRAIFNSGNRRGAVVPRCVGDKHEVIDFAIFSPKLLAGIDASRWPDTIRDRSIEIVLRRKRRDESVQRFRRRDVAPLADQIRDRCNAWATPERIAELSASRPALPDQLDDRAADSWEPLLAIADEAQGAWPESAREAARILSGNRLDFSSDSAAVRLLADIATVFDKRGSRVSSTDLLAGLHALDEAPWGDPPQLTPRRLAEMLRPFGIRRSTIRIGDTTAKGYKSEDFGDSFARYLGGTHGMKRKRPSGVTPVTSVTPKAPRDGDVTDVTDVTATGHRPNPFAALSANGMKEPR